VRCGMAWCLIPHPTCPHSLRWACTNTTMAAHLSTAGLRWPLPSSALRDLAPERLRLWDLERLRPHELTGDLPRLPSVLAGIVFATVQPFSP
jgi:hypothetical protein